MNIPCKYHNRLDAAIRIPVLMLIVGTLLAIPMQAQETTAVAEVPSANPRHVTREMAIGNVDPALVDAMISETKSEGATYDIFEATRTVIVTDTLESIEAISAILEVFSQEAAKTAGAKLVHDPQESTPGNAGVIIVHSGPRIVPFRPGAIRGRPGAIRGRPGVVPLRPGPRATPGAGPGTPGPGVTPGPGGGRRRVVR